MKTLVRQANPGSLRNRCAAEEPLEVCPRGSYNTYMSNDNLSSFPFDWFRNHLVNGILPHWLDAAATDNGFFWPQL
ncbi:MAG TPA: hypothetical protein VM186_14265, partial [Planctomycetota bacterium]|nr:hypothetical protein [Planctomycetota bacterium]